MCTFVISLVLYILSSYTARLWEFRTVIASLDHCISNMLSSLGVAVAQTVPVRSQAREVQRATTGAQPHRATQNFLYRCPLGLGTRRFQITRDARGFGILGNAKRKPLWPWSDRGREGSRTPPLVTNFAVMIAYISNSLR